jgi:hypothetical protein
MSGPPVENPVLVRPEPCVPSAANPLYIPYGELSYGAVFEKVLDVVDDYFEIAYANRFDGRIETIPRVAPGLGQPWKASNPDCDERLLATLQSIRHRATVLIHPADDTGFFIDVKVFKELEDVPRPTRSLAGDAVFRSDTLLERPYNVTIVDDTTLSPNWILLGRDTQLEQIILGQIQQFDMKGVCPPPK